MTTSISSAIIIAGNNDRKKFDIPALLELAANIAFYGLAQPPVVRPVFLTAEGGILYHPALLDLHESILQGTKSRKRIKVDGQFIQVEKLTPVFEIVAGERRVRAMRDILKRDQIPVSVEQLDNERAAAIMLAENTARTDLNPIEEARAYQRRIENGMSMEEVASMAGKRVEYVRNRVKLLALPEDVQHLVRYGNLPVGHAELLVRLDVNRMRLAVRTYNGVPSMSLRAFRDLISKLEGEQVVERAKGNPLFDLSAYESLTPEAAANLCGRKAIVGAPVSDALPAVRMGSRDGVGDIFDRYTADLLAAGLEAEAAAVGMLYTALVAKNFVSVPLVGALQRVGATAGEAARIGSVDKS